MTRHLQSVPDKPEDFTPPAIAIGVKENPYVISSTPEDLAGVTEQIDEAGLNHREIVFARRCGKSAVLMTAAVLSQEFGDDIVNGLSVVGEFFKGGYHAVQNR